MPVEPLNGPFHTNIRVVDMCYGVIVQVDAQHGSPPWPTGDITISQSGVGAVTYEGYNSALVNPGNLGSPVRWSIYLCPVKKGMTTVHVNFKMTNNTTVSVPFTFDIH